MQSQVGLLPLQMKDVVGRKVKLPRVLYSCLWNLMLIFCVVVYGSYTVLVHLCEEDGAIPFSSSSVVLLIETTKIVVSLCLFSPELRHRGSVQFPSPKTCITFLIPALMYCINNNIAVHMQLHMDPTTYQVLGNMKIGTTAVLYRVIIKKRLTGLQWISLGLLTLAGIFDSYGGFHSKGSSHLGEIHITAAGLLLITMYCVISGLAGVYTEYILKQHYQTSLHLQNILLYTFGILLNGVLWLTQGSRDPVTGSQNSFFKGYSMYTWIIILSQAANGLIMSVVMKHASNITRLFLISCAMLVTTALSLLVFRLTFNIWFILAFILILVAVSLYHRQ